MSFLVPILAAVAGGLASSGGSALFGKKAKKEKFQQRSKLSPAQQPLLQNAIDAGMKPGAGGAFGQAADYYRNNLSDDPATMELLSKPEMRKFNEQIVPDLAEQFAGMGSGNLTSSGFRNAAVNSGVDLSERLGAMRANLRSQSAAGLANIGQLGLGDYTNNIYQQSQPSQGGFLEAAAPGIAEAGVQGAMDYFNQGKTANVVPSPTASALPNFKSQTNKGPISNKGQTSPYGQQGGGRFGLPNFGGF